MHSTPVRRDSSQLRRVLVVDGGPPDPTASAGLRASLDLLDGLVALGADVSLFTMGATGENDAALFADLRRRGVDRFFQRDTTDLAELVSGEGFDTVIANRPGPGILTLAALDRRPETARIYWGHDIYQRRFAGQVRVEGGTLGHAGKALQLAEERCWRTFDLSAYPTYREARLVDEFLGQRRGFALPYFRLTAEELDDAGPGQLNSSQVLFVGAAQHAPNRDAVQWAVSDILPLLQRDDPEVRLVVVGEWPRADIAALQGPAVHFTGVVSAEELRRLHATSLCLLAPLRFGSGTRRKIVSAMGWGLPVVTTSEGQEGVLVRDGGGADDGLLIADSPAEIAAAVQGLRNLPGVGRRSAARAQAAVRRVYDQRGFAGGLAEALIAADVNRDRRLAEGSDSTVELDRSEAMNDKTSRERESDGTAGSVLHTQ